jgi:hypothetical protein
MFGQSLLAKYLVKSVLNEMGADPFTQSIVATGVGWIAASLTFDHHSQILGHMHDAVDNASNLLDVGSTVTEHTATLPELVHNITTNPNVLSLIAEHTSEHTATLPELVHNITTNPNVLSLIAEHSYTNPLVEASTLIVDQISQNHRDLFSDSFDSSNQSVHHVDYRSGEILNGVDMQFSDAHKKVEKFHQKFHNYPLHTGPVQWQKADDFLKNKLSVDYKAGKILDISKILTGNIDLSHLPIGNYCGYSIMFSNFKQAYHVEPYLAMAAVLELPFTHRCGFTAYMLGNWDFSDKLLPDPNLMAQALGTL